MKKFFKNLNKFKYYSKKFNSNNPTAGCLIIGDEILTGKTQDTNSNFLAKHLFEKGIDLKEICIIEDEKNLIINKVKSLSNKFDYVFTSGGIGTTHDDVTYESIAEAFNLNLKQHEETKKKMEYIYGKMNKDLNQERLKMSILPEKSITFYSNDVERYWTPVALVKNILILPGIPEIFKELIQNNSKLNEYLKEGKPLHRIILFSKNKFEGDFSSALSLIAKEYLDHVKIGSYPNMNESKDYHVKITIEGHDELVMKIVENKIQEIIN